MYRRIRAGRRSEQGFTLIELLVVIIILGILAAVVVFAVGGVGDKGQAASVSTDEKTIRTAEEAYCAQNGRYASGQELVAGGFLSEVPTYHQVDARLAGGSCNGWKFFILKTAQAGSYGTGSWELTTPPPAIAFVEYLVRLADGRVLVGGFDGSFSAFVQQILDLSTGIWSSPTDPFPIVPQNHSDAAILLTDDPLTPGSECAGLVNNCGKVLVFGRYLFDPAISPGTTGQWQTLSAPGCNICNNGGPAATQVQMMKSSGECGSVCGDVFIFTGNGTGVLGYDIFDPRTSSYVTVDYPDGNEGITSNLAGSVGRYATQLPNGMILVCCMISGSSLDPPAARILDPETNTVTIAPTPPSRASRLYDPQPTPVLPNGDIFHGDVFYGGGDTMPIYSPTTGQWKTAPTCVDLSIDQWICRILGSVGDGRILALKAFAPDCCPTQETYIFDPVSNSWSRADDINSTLSFTWESLWIDGGSCGSYCGKMLTIGEGSAELFTP